MLALCFVVTYGLYEGGALGKRFCRMGTRCPLKHMPCPRRHGSTWKAKRVLPKAEKKKKKIAATSSPVGFSPRLTRANIKTPATHRDPTRNPLCVSPHL